MARSIGADHVIDYTMQDFTRDRQRYDLILAVNGHHPLAAYKRALNPQGIYVCVGGTLTQFFQAMLLGPVMSRSGGKRLGSMGLAKFNQEDLVYLGELLEAGAIVPRIDRTYPLSEVPEAIRYVEEIHAQGKVVITVEHGSKTQGLSANYSHRRIAAMTHITRSYPAPKGRRISLLPVLPCHPIGHRSWMELHG
jgi:NADPH:quinone reductase-like Zn-dependent oxidoreductase